MNEENAILFGVGTGPGDPELMTVKAVKAIEQADVVAYFAKKEISAMPAKSPISGWARILLSCRFIIR